MIRHIVMWRFAPEAEGKSREENMDAVKERLLKLPAIIPQLKRMEIGKDVLGSEMSYDMVLITEFESISDMKLYKNHPEHLKISEYVSRVRTARATVDYEL